jgi:hypothetical protein
VTGEGIPWARDGDRGKLPSIGGTQGRVLDEGRTFNVRWSCCKRGSAAGPTVLRESIGTPARRPIKFVVRKDDNEPVGSFDYDDGNIGSWQDSKVSVIRR